MPSAAFTDAWVKYLTQFPDLASLGTGTPPSAWAAELAVIQPQAFDQIKGTSINFEGGNLQGVSNYDQMQLVRALYAVRAERDPDFTNPYTLAVPEPMAGRRMGSVVRLGRSSAI